MGRLLRLIINSGGLFTFAILELLCLYLIVHHNDGQRAIWLETKSVYGSFLTEKINEKLAFLDVARENEVLRRENAALLARIPGSEYDTRIDTASVTDSAFQQRFTYLASRIVNKSPYGPYNTLIIDRGSNLQVERGQGVVTDGGLLGIVSEVTPRHARVISILHLDTRISAGLDNNAFGTLRWDGKDPRRVTITDMPDYIPVAPNDTVFTTGYSNVFPTGLPIGTVESSDPLPGTGSQNLTVVLLNDPLTAANGYVVRDLFKEELDRLNRVR
ncbi:rod shape-determining protein MreC [Lewinella sp. JB7]|uniref:rod shape-determining protein MreC n=1 Tax=Lewinella sp. JB7 TaxID=2962887 RepID=UPI0020C9959A|nr:rod shape-determining protein MreC [Lewinella sp. JB7]MCP9235652.1 rod shape-determining protein MreC [Lewinella sp. JB7]